MRKTRSVLKRSSDGQRSSSGSTLYVLAIYIAFNSVYGLFIRPRLTDTHESAWGIAIGLMAKVGMPILAGYKFRVAARLNSRALRADGMESITVARLKRKTRFRTASFLTGKFEDTVATIPGHFDL